MLYIIVGGLCLTVGVVAGILIAANNKDAADKAKSLATKARDAAKEQLKH